MQFPTKLCHHNDNVTWITSYLHLIKLFYKKKTNKEKFHSRLSNNYCVIVGSMSSEQNVGVTVQCVHNIDTGSKNTFLYQCACVVKVPLFKLKSFVCKYTLKSQNRLFILYSEKYEIVSNKRSHLQPGR